MTTGAGLRIAWGGIWHETNTYADACTGATTAEAFDVYRGQEAVERFAGTETYGGGTIAAADEIGALLRPTVLAIANPSGTIDRSFYDRTKAELVDALSAEPVDAVVLEVHGAGAAVGVDDIEADLVAAVRRVVGPRVPVVAALDLHANVTAAMARGFDLLLGVHHYPHTDMAERAHECVSLLPRLVDRTIRPVIHVERLPMLLPSSTTSVAGPAADVNGLCAELERRAGVVDCTFFHGFPCTDSPVVGAGVVAIADGDPALAEQTARAVAREVWRRREDFQPEVYSPEEAIQRALAVDGGPVVINDTADNPDGGGPGDGTHLLRAMLQADLRDACFSHIYDPGVAAQAHEAGVGARLRVRLGGKHCEVPGQPLDVDAEVAALSDGRFTLRAMFSGLEADLGAMACLRIGGVEVLVSSRRQQVFDPGVFELHGIDVTRRKVVAVKSSNHFRAGFAPLAKAVITADSPGISTTARFDLLPRQRTPRPIWPLDPAAAYPPTSEL